MKRWMAQLDTACAWVNPALVIVAMILVMLDVAAAGQRWTLAHPPVAATAVVVATRNEQCAAAIPPELRDMVGRD
jgi:hypothetical protein